MWTSKCTCRKFHFFVFSETFSQCSAAQSCHTTQGYFASILVEEGMPNMMMYSDFWKILMIFEKRRECDNTSTAGWSTMLLSTLLFDIPSYILDGQLTWLFTMLWGAIFTLDKRNDYYNLFMIICFKNRKYKLFGLKYSRSPLWIYIEISIVHTSQLSI